MKAWKLWQAPTTIEFNIFCWNVARVSYLQRLQKDIGIFLFCLDLKLFAKIKKTWFLDGRFLHFY